MSQQPTTQATRTRAQLTAKRFVARARRRAPPAGQPARPLACDTLPLRSKMPRSSSSNLRPGWFPARETF